MSVLKLFSGLAVSLRAKSVRDKPIVDNFVFRLHYRFTSIFFFAASILLTASDLFGKPILCTFDTNLGRPEALNTYCWIRHTFTIPLNASYVDRNLTDSTPHPGISPEHWSTEKRIHSYYQWVPFMLFFQGLLFYLPHGIWKRQEGGMIGRLTDGTRGLILKKEDLKLGGRSNLADYLHETMGSYGHLGVAHVTCELFNLVNAVGNIYLIDLFLGGTFINYGWRAFEISQASQWNRHDRMIEIFPRVTKCTFHKYGSSGSIQRHDGMCILPLNILNEKIYVFIWFWLICLSFLSFMAIVYRMAVVKSLSVRRFVFNRLTPITDPDTTSAMSQSVSYSDCYLLFMLSKNLPNYLFRDLVVDLVQRMNVSQLDD